MIAAVTEWAPVWMRRERHDTVIDVLKDLQRLVDKELGFARAKDIPCSHLALNADDTRRG